MAKAGRTAAAIVLLIAVVLTIAALFMPWYTEEFSASGQSASQNAYLGFPSTNGTIQYSCSGTSSCPPQTSYSAVKANNTGNLAEMGYLVVLVDIVLGLVAVGLAFASRGNARRTGAAVALGVVAMILAIAATGYFAVALPGAIGSDSPNHPGNGPWSSFFGSNSTGGGGTLTWGPAIGWYLCLGAFILFLVGVVVLARARGDPPTPLPVAVPAAPPAPSAP